MLGLMLGLMLAALTVPRPAAAHKPSDSYLALTVGADRIEGRWDIALRDLDHAIGLDGNDDGAITWGEVKARRETVGRYALARLRLETVGVSCTTHARDLLIDEHSDGPYAVLTFAADCAGPRAPLVVGYRLFFDLDPQHRGLVKVAAGGAVTSTVIGPDRPDWRVDPGHTPVRQQVSSFFVEGLRHIAAGLDHVLFLISLLLPAVLRYRDGGWRPVARIEEAIGDVVGVVTAFTVAHSITLALATFGLVTVPAAIVEPLIAASIVFAAINNIRPMVTRGLWLVAFGFGLVHGIGFADALQDLGLASHELLVPLLSFNLGVEAGQLLVVAALVPAAFLLRRSAAYPRVALQFGSLLIAAIGSLWMIERAFGIALLT
jgi:HupE / UreJ protein